MYEVAIDRDQSHGKVRWRCRVGRAGDPMGDFGTCGTQERARHDAWAIVQMMRKDPSWGRPE